DELREPESGAASGEEQIEITATGVTFAFEQQSLSGRVERIGELRSGELPDDASLLSGPELDQRWFPLDDRVADHARAVRRCACSGVAFTDGRHASRSAARAV